MRLRKHNASLHRGVYPFPNAEMTFGAPRLSGAAFRIILFRMRSTVNFARPGKTAVPARHIVSSENSSSSAGRHVYLKIPVPLSKYGDSVRCPAFRRCRRGCGDLSYRRAIPSKNVRIISEHGGHYENCGVVSLERDREFSAYLLCKNLSGPFL